LGIEGRCPLDPNAPNAWESGDLDRMFEKLSSEPYLSDYDVHILSSPNTTGGPWIITMENVVSEEEAERLIQLGAKMGYKRSKDIGKVKADGTTQEDISSGRTSTNAWCTGACYKDDKAQDVIQRLSNITGILEVNSEYLQLLKVNEYISNCSSSLRDT
jgi:prolyl 4-hydroxylase